MTVDVTLIDGATGEVLGRFAQAAEDLPADFGRATKLHLGAAVWQVESAVPATREEYARGGALRLVLRKAPPVQMIRAAELKFSMSSICDVLPPDGEPCGDQLPLVVKDDLWLDVELVGPGHAAAIERNFAAIHRVQTERRSGPRFARMHVRAEPRAPFEGVGLTVAQLTATLGAEQRNPVTIDGYAGCMPGGFALVLRGGVVVYGRENASEVVVAGVEHVVGDASAVAGPLFALMAEHGLSLVDWRSRLRIDDEASLAQWLGLPPAHLWR